MSAPVSAVQPARVPLTTGFVLGNTVALLAATGVAATALWPVYQSGAFVLLVAVAAVLGCGIALVGARWRWPAWQVGAASALAYLIVGVPLAVPGQAIFGVLPSLSGLAELMPATVLSWKQLVTIVLPVGSYQALLVPALILVLLSTVTGLSLALRSPAAEPALLAPIVLLVAGIALGPGSSAAAGPLGLGLFAVLALWLLGLNQVRRRRRLLLLATTPRLPADRRAGATRSILTAAAVLLVAVLGGTLEIGRAHV